MTTKDQGNRFEDGFEDVFNGLEQLAQNLDAQKYPGQAWPAARQLPTRPIRRWIWKIAVSVSAAAAVAAMLHHYHAASRPQLDPMPNVGIDAALAWAFSESPYDEEPAIPEILILEDLDSYSIIDMTTGMPLVSFATKDTYSPVCVVPLLPEPSS